MQRHPGSTITGIGATFGISTSSGARGISPDEAAVLPRNRHVVVHDPRGPGTRRFLIGASDGRRVLTLVIEWTMEPTTWLIVTGWDATAAERRILSRAR